MSAGLRKNPQFIHCSERIAVDSFLSIAIQLWRSTQLQNWNSDNVANVPFVLWKFYETYTSNLVILSSDMWRWFVSRYWQQKRNLSVLDAIYGVSIRQTWDLGYRNDYAHLDSLCGYRFFSVYFFMRFYRGQNRRIFATLTFLPNLDHVRFSQHQLLNIISHYLVLFLGFSPIWNDHCRLVMYSYMRPRAFRHV